MGYSTNSQKLGVGDPFVHSKIGGILKKAGGFLGGPIGAGLKGVGGIIQGGPATTITTAVQPPHAAPGGSIPSGFAPTRLGASSAGGAAKGAGFGGKTKRRRRMDPLNVKALRRSTRRLAAFQREAKKVEKELKKLAPPARRRSSRRDSGPGHTHVR